MLESKDDYALKSIEIDTSKRISQVSMKVKATNTALCAMRLIDNTGSNVAELNWCQPDEASSPSDAAEWITRDIQDDYEIIGIYMSTTGLQEYIQSLGFMLWKPNPNATD